MDCLKVDGKQPVDRDKLTMLVMVGDKIDRHSLSKRVGIGSRSHCLSEDDVMRRVISSTVAGRKVLKAAGAEGGSGECGDEAVVGISDWSRKILSRKKEEKDCAVEDGSDEELDGTELGELRWRSELIVCQSLRGLD